MSGFWGEADLYDVPLECSNLDRFGRAQKPRFRKLKGRNRPTTALQAHTCECPRPDRKTDIADEAIIVRRGNHLDGPFSQAQPGNWSNISGRLGLARDGHVIMTYHVIH